MRGPTLSRFYSFHFVLPLLGLVGVLGHIRVLHKPGSRNPLGLRLRLDKRSFHPYFSGKDAVILRLVLLGLGLIVCWGPYVLGDPDNFTPANPIVTPEHIKPE